MRRTKLKLKLNPVSLCSCLLFFFLFHVNSQSQPSPNTTGYTCNPNQTTYPCQTYVFYRATSPNFLDIASIGDLFNISRLMISEPSNISTPSAPLIHNQSLFVPISCSCNTVNVTFGSLSASNLTYTIQQGDTFYLVSSNNFQNLTTFQSVEVFNPSFVPTQLDIGDRIVFPVFCKCANQSQIRNQVNFLVSYVFQQTDSLSAIASLFGVQAQAITDINGDNIQPFDTIFIPVNRLPVLSQPEPPTVTVSSTRSTERKGLIIGLSIGLATCGILLASVLVVLLRREGGSKRRAKDQDGEIQRLKMNNKSGIEASLMADVSDCLDKYRVFKIEEIREATDCFDDSCLIQGSVYKGLIDGDVYAIKKMKWNACEELKILQKVNHGNLVKLEGFCIDPEDANCYLVYEFVENGPLSSWLHENVVEKLNWKTRLRIAVDVANGLQYIHEHTRPRVVHKDIKTSNILLDINMRAKIANFGLAKSGCNAITMHIVGTQGYIAPEYLADGVVSTKMDVFSFGVVLLELVSGLEAIDEEGKLLWASVERVLDGNEEMKVRKVKEFMDGCLLQESLSMEGLMNVMSVAIACVHKNPTKRPSMVDIVYALCKSDDLIFDESEDNLSAPPIAAR